MTQVLVLDAGQRSALAATRSLGRRGLTVHVADARRPTLAGASRYARSELEHPDPSQQPEAFTDWVIDTAARLGVQAVLPLTDLSIMLLAPARERLGSTELLCAPHAAYDIVSDKAKLIDIARRVAVPTPRTTLAASRAELEALLATCHYPVVLKPARSKVMVEGRIVSTSVLIAHSESQARAYASRQTWLGTMPCLLQEFVPGHGAGLFALYGSGRPLAWFAHRRIREKPPSGGVSVLSESAAVDERLRAAAERLLDACAWNGPAMVEFKVARDGTAYLMEINGRLWGSLQLAIDCGVDFPWLMYQSACGAIADAAQPGYAPGRRLRWLLGDVDHLLIRLREQDSNAAAKLRSVGAFLASCIDFSARQEVFRWSDPRPGARELASWIGSLGSSS